MKHKEHTQQINSHTSKQHFILKKHRLEGVPFVLHPHFGHFLILTNVIYSALYYQSLMPKAIQAFSHQEKT